MSHRKYYPATFRVKAVILFPRMKQPRSIVLLLLLLLATQEALPQYKTPAGEELLFKKYRQKGDANYHPQQLFYTGMWNTAIPKNIKPVRRLGEHNAIIEINSRQQFEQLSKQIMLAPASDSWKLSAAAENALNKKSSRPQQFIITAKDSTSLTYLLENTPAAVNIITVNAASNSLVIECSADLVKQQFINSFYIIFIDVKAAPHNEINIVGYDRSFDGINAVDYLLTGANGKDIVVGVKEQQMDENDIDLYKRVLPSPISTSDTTYHATVISSIIGGAGNSFYNGRGIANHCTFFPSSFTNLFADDASVLNANHVTVQNHSYGTVIQQFYGAEAVSYDALAWNDKTIVPVFSAGNQGSGFAAEGPYANMPGHANITGNFKMAKNVITVGATDNKDVVAPESSAGPLYDGRIAPQLIALGPNGTSDAAAVVSGTIAVIQQVYADSNQGHIPPASLTKAILYNTADDIYNTGIDYKTGYGMLNSYAAVTAVMQKNYDSGFIAQGRRWTKTINIPANTAQLKVTLSWTDTVSAINNSKAIINDADLEVKETASGIVYKPWVLSAAANADSLMLLPERKRDSLNTSEQVSIRLPAAGSYEISVAGYDISTASLPFHIAFKTDTLHTFRFTNPLHTSDVNREENELLKIKWRTFVADTNETGDLYMSYDRGKSWQLLAASYKIYTGGYNWLIKDTASTAQLKMQTGFGTFFSGEFIISDITRPVADFVCTDSSRLSWRKYVYADSYKIFMFTDSPYLKNILMVSDTFVSIKHALYPGSIFAVQPVLSNGIEAARSRVTDLNSQGVGCFYKTYYYTLPDPNSIELVLELSATGYIDSVSFENISAGGHLLQTYGSQKVMAGLNLYRQLVNNPPAGTVYTRARIKLKNGAVVYTNTIAVLTTGPKYLLVFPNPTQKQLLLDYSLRQGVAGDSKLQLFDMSGRLVKYYNFLPVKIDVSGLASGLYIYKLISTENVTLETGKLLIE